MRLGRARFYHAGEVIYSQGGLSTAVRVILDGSVKMTARSSSGGETLLEIRTQGDLLGEREVLRALGVTHATEHSQAPGGKNLPTGGRSPKPSPGRAAAADALRHPGAARRATATALRPSQVLIIPGEEFARFLTVEPNAWTAMAQDLEARLSEAELRLRGIASEGANRRLARALLSLSMSTALAGVERTSLRLSQAELASWIGTSRETVERVLRDWRNRRIIETGYRTITVLQVGDLMRVAGMRWDPRPRSRPA
jgi:CRP/FNR family transcriptional regulator, cyclic AMP receptor protein